MFYVIERNYIGPYQNQEFYFDVDKIEITTAPAITNSTHEECIEGWSIFCHGEYATIEEARAAITEEFGEVRDGYMDGNSFEPSDEHVVEIYKPGKFEPMSREKTYDWAIEGIVSEIEMDTSDSRIAELVAEFEAEANSQGYTLDSDLRYFMLKRREKMLHLYCDELEDED